MKKLNLAFGLLLIAATAFSQTILVNGVSVLVNDQAKFPIWLKAGEPLNIGVNVIGISVIEYNVVASPSGGNVLTLEQVVKVTGATSVPAGKAWKVEAVLLDPAVSSSGNGWTDDGTVVRLATATDNVGIGNISPSHQLHVGVSNGDAQAVTIRGYSNTPTNWKGGAAFGYTSGSVIMGELSGVPQIGGQNTTLSTWSNLAINSGGGNVGIGTTSPLAKLTIGAGSLADANVPVQMSTGASPTEAYYGVNKNGAYGLLMGYSNGSGLGTKAIIRNVTADPLSFYVNNTTEAMTIISNGNMGIGTATPNNRFEVFGDGVRNVSRASTTAGEVEIEAQVSNYWSGPTYTGTALQQYGSTATGTNVGISNVNLGILRFQNVANALIYTNGGAPIIFGTTSTERMRIDPSGNVKVANLAPSSKVYTDASSNLTTTVPSAAALKIKKGQYALVTGITYHLTTPTTTYTIPVTLPANTKAIFIAVYYVHNGAANHGYLNFDAYQQNATASDDKTTFLNSHYNDYFNTDYYEEMVPWNSTGSGNAVTIQVTSSYNSSTSNYYNIYYTGYLAGD